MDGFREYASDNMGKLIFFSGAVFLAIGVLTSSMLGTVLSAVSLFLGITMVFAGMFMQMGLFSNGIRSLSGLGMLLILIAIVVLAFGLVSLEFLDVVAQYYVPVLQHSYVPPTVFRWIAVTERPYVWISNLCFRLGIGFLVFGAAVKFASLLRH